MSTPTGDLPSLVKFLGAHERVIPLYVQNLKRVGLDTLTPEALVRRRLTGTLAASEKPIEGDAGGRGLQYGPGHTPLGQAARDAVLAASPPFGAVGSVNDAVPGNPYGLLIENVDGLHAEVAAELPGVLQAAADQAWDDAFKEALR